MPDQSPVINDDEAAKAPPRPPQPPNGPLEESARTIHALAKRMWKQATNLDHPAWPPVWLMYLAVTCVVAVFIAVILLISSAAQAFGNWLTDRATWLAGWDLTQTVTGPVRSYIDVHGAALPVSADAQMTGWVIAGGALVVLSIAGYTGARIGWALFGAATAAMVWSQTPRPGEWAAVAITAACWTLLAIPAYRRRSSTVRVVSDGPQVFITPDWMAKRGRNPAPYPTRKPEPKPTEQNPGEMLVYRGEIGADGCGCPITALIDVPTGADVEGTQRTDHRPNCWNDPKT